MSRMNGWKLALFPVLIMIMIGFTFPPIAAAGPMTLEGAVDNPVQKDGTTPLVFSTTTPLWSTESTTYYSGGANTWAAQSGVLSSVGLSSSLTTTVYGPASISFYQKISSRPVSNTLTFSIDNKVKSTVSGSVDWKQQMFTLPTGTHALVWKYRKTANNTGTLLDAAWLDKVVVSPNTALTVTYPKGGENLISGSTATITWNAPAAAETYDLYLSKDNGVSWDVKHPIAQNFTGAAYPWPVPVPAGGNKTACRVKVVAKNAANAVVGTGVSAKPFAIEVLRVTAPNGGEILSAKTGTYTIGFVVSGLTDTSASATATISYTIDGGVTWPVIGKTPSGAITPGSYTFDWKVPVVSTVKNAKVKVVISKPGVVLATDTSNANFTILPVFTISGVATLNNKALAGVTMTLGGDDSGTTTTDAKGKYSFTTLLKGNYTVSAAMTGAIFNPASTALAVTTANITTANFKATSYSSPTYSISGVVSGATSTGVTVTLGGALGGTVKTDNSGNYAFGNLPAGSYTVVPGKTGYTFDPLSSGVTVTTDTTGVDFTSSASTGATYSISGKVTSNSKALPGVLVSMTTDGVSATAITGPAGTYVIKGLKSKATYTITPSKFGYTFTPPTKSGTIAGANVTNANFAATAHATAIGTVASGAPISGVTVTLNDSAIVPNSRTAITSGDGTYGIDATGLTPPFLLLATTGTGSAFYSVSADAAVIKTINITPLTDLIIRSWYGVQEDVSMDAAFAAPGSYPPPSPTAVGVISSVVQNMVQLWLNQAGVTTSGFNLISTPFSANGTGVDLVLDQAAVNAATGQVNISGGGVTQNSLLTAATGSISLVTSTTGSGGTSTNSYGTVVPVPTAPAQQTALDDITTIFSNFAAVVNARGALLAASDLTPFMDPAGVWSGFTRSQWAQELVYALKGKTISFSGIAIKSFNDAVTTADTTFQLSQSQGGQTSVSPEELSEFFFKQVNGAWLMSGDGRIADVEVRANMVRNQGSGTSVDLTLEVNVDAPRSAPTITSLTGVTITGGPWNAYPLSYNGQNVAPWNSALTLDSFGTYTLNPSISEGELFTVAVTPSLESAATYTSILNAITTEAVSITNLTGGTLADAHPGSPLTVDWTLPNTFAISQVRLGTVAYTGKPNDSSTFECDDQGMQVVLGITSTTAQVTIPAFCHGKATLYAELYLQVYGVNGELTSVYYTYGP